MTILSADTVQFIRRIIVNVNMLCIQHSTVQITVQYCTDYNKLGEKKQSSQTMITVYNAIIFIASKVRRAIWVCGYVWVGVGGGGWGWVGVGVCGCVCLGLCESTYYIMYVVYFLELHLLLDFAH